MMADLSMYEVLSWVQQNAEKAVAEQNLSNFLVVLYAIAYGINKKAAFLVAFLLIELYGYSSIGDALTAPQFYLGYAVIYTATYWFVFKCYGVNKTLLGYVTLIIFELTMATDAVFYAKVKTIMYDSYPYVIVLVHLYIIISLFEWKRIKHDMGVFARSLLCIIWPSYNYSLFCYTKAYSTSSKEIR